MDDDDDNLPEESEEGPGYVPQGRYRRPQRPKLSDWGFINDLTRPLGANDNDNDNDNENKNKNESENKNE